MWLHGLFGDHMRFHERGGAEVLDQCVGEGKLPPCVFVSANGGRTSMYFNRKDQRWEDLITVDLLAHLNKTYRVSEQARAACDHGREHGRHGRAAHRVHQAGTVRCRRRAQRGGVRRGSRAAAGRLKEAREGFGLDEVFGNPIQKEPWQKANPLASQRRRRQGAQHAAHLLRRRHRRPLRFASGNQSLHEALDKKGVSHTWRLIEGGGHSWGAHFQDQTLPYSFAMVGQMFAGKDGKAARKRRATRAMPGRQGAEEDPR
jgi:hypothetical protein